MNVRFNGLFFIYICVPLLIVFELSRMVDALVTFIVSICNDSQNSMKWLHPT